MWHYLTHLYCYLVTHVLLWQTFQWPLASRMVRIGLPGWGHLLGNGEPFWPKATFAANWWCQWNIGHSKVVSRKAGMREDRGHWMKVSIFLLHSFVVNVTALLSQQDSVAVTKWQCHCDNVNSVAVTTWQCCCHNLTMSLWQNVNVTVTTSQCRCHNVTVLLWQHDVVTVTM